MPLRVLHLLESCYCYISTIADHEFTNYERAQAVRKHQDCQIVIWKTASSRTIETNRYDTHTRQDTKTSIGETI